TPLAHTAALGPAPAAQPLQLVIPLVADDAGLRRFALAVSTPTSPSYGHYLPISKLARRFGAPLAAQARVVRYLRAVGATQVAASPTGMYVAATMSVAVAERTFGTSLARFQSSQGERFIAPVAVAHTSAGGGRLPGPLNGLALGVVGLNTRRVVPPSIPHRRSTRALAPNHASSMQPPSDYSPVTGTPSGCLAGRKSGGFTPNQYLTAYGYNPLHSAGLGGQGVRVALIEIDRFKRSDLATFVNCFGLHVPAISVYSLGPQSAIPFGEESTLDAEVLTAAAPNLKSLEVFESNGDAAQVDRSFIAPLVAPGAKAQVISASLGLCEPNMLQDFGRAGIRTVERGLSLAAATGITVVAASGDNGSAECINGQGNPVNELAANYPASSPWVTSVGGTNVHLNSANQIQSQMVWNDTTDQIGAGGGGFSGVFPRPRYQTGIVGQNSRAVPDVSMLADVAPGFAIFCTAQGTSGCQGWTTVGGTSAATPLLAGGIALVNQDLHKHQRELIGFLNPLLYQLGTGSSSAQVFSDVTGIGNDVGPWIPGGGGRPLGCCTAASGFDEASGWGSVDLAQLDAIALQLLPQFGDVSMSLLRHQLPVGRHLVSLKLTCTSACSVFAFGFIKIHGGHSFVLRSRGYSLAAAGSMKVSIRFTRRQETWLRAGIRKHRGILAEIFAAALDARGQLADVTAGQLLFIHG
ncbi:MAG: S53 family peptidase, partial [Actinomycetota bacterium]|nr:S53 family peptidase [Actinomycetota bacterium]